jgi:hypothetical protein
MQMIYRGSASKPQVTKHTVAAVDMQTSTTAHQLHHPPVHTPDLPHINDTMWQ